MTESGFISLKLHYSVIDFSFYYFRSLLIDPLKVTVEV